MKIKSIMAIAAAVVILTGCSSPQRITLKDNTTIDSRDEVKYNRKTGYYEYQDISGKTHRVNSDSVLKIEEL